MTEHPNWVVVVQMTINEDPDDPMPPDPAAYGPYEKTEADRIAEVIMLQPGVLSVGVMQLIRI